MKNEKKFTQADINSAVINEKAKNSIAFETLAFTAATMIITGSLLEKKRPNASPLEKLGHASILVSVGVIVSWGYSTLKTKLYNDKVEAKVLNELLQKDKKAV